MKNPPATVLDPTPAAIGDDVRIKRWRISEAAAFITTLVVIGATATMFLPWSRGDILGTFTFEHIQLLHMVDTGPQRLAHRVALVLLAVLCALGGAIITVPAAHTPAVTQILRITGRFLRKWVGVFLAVAAMLVLVFNLKGTIFPGPVGQKLQLVFWVLSTALIALGLFLARYRKTRGFAVAIWSSIGAYSLFLIIPGMARIPRVFEADLGWIDWHYSVTLAQGDRLASGLRLSTNVNLNYGLIHSLLLGTIERHWGLFDFGSHLRVVQCSQIAFILVAIFAFYLWRPGNPLFALFGAVLIGPWVSTSHVSIYYPNQSGWRSLGLALGVAILITCRRQPLRRAAIMLGASSCFLLLYNPETGLCLALGYGLFLLSRYKNLTFRQVGGIALRAVAGAAIIFLIVLGLYRVGLGTWPPLSAAPLFGFIAKFGQGYGGLPLYFDPLAILIFVHSIFIVSTFVLKWRVRHLEFDESVKLGIGATILVWAGYYANRPQAWNLWTFQFLYLFLVADLFEPGLFTRLRRYGLVTAVFDFRFVSLTLILLPMLVAMNYFNVLATAFPEKPAEITTAMVSGISIPGDSASILRKQANYLASSEASSTLFFSRHSYSLSLLTRRFNALPVQDAFAETITNSDFESLVREIYKISPRVILFDAHDDATDNSAVSFYEMRFFDRLKSRLAKRYRRGATTNGWQLWQLPNAGEDSDVSHGSGEIK